MGQGSTALSTPKLGRMWNSVGMGASLKYQTSTDILYSQCNTDNFLHTDRQTDIQISKAERQRNKETKWSVRLRKDLDNAKIKV